MTSSSPISMDSAPEWPSAQAVERTATGLTRFRDRTSFSARNVKESSYPALVEVVISFIYLLLDADYELDGEGGCSLDGSILSRLLPTFSVPAS